MDLLEVRGWPGTTHEPLGHIFTGGFAKAGEKTQAPHLSRRSSADSSSKSGEMGKVEAAKLIISGPAHICPHCAGTATFLTGCGF